MRKMLIILCLCFSLGTMTACEKEISYVVEKNDVVFVQVIEVQEHSNEILFSVLFQVDEQAIDDFIDDLALIPFTRVYGDPQGFSGDCFYIGYEMKTMK